MFLIAPETFRSRPLLEGAPAYQQVFLLNPPKPLFEVLHCLDRHSPSNDIADQATRDDITLFMAPFIIEAVKTSVSIHLPTPMTGLGHQCQGLRPSDGPLWGRERFIRVEVIFVPLDGPAALWVSAIQFPPICPAALSALRASFFPLKTAGRIDLPTCGTFHTFLGL